MGRLYNGRAMLWDKKVVEGMIMLLDERMIIVLLVEAQIVGIYSGVRGLGLVIIEVILMGEIVIEKLVTEWMTVV